MEWLGRLADERKMLERTTTKWESTVLETKRSLLALSVTALFVFAVFLGNALAADGDDSTTKSKDNGYRGIWFTLGQFSDAPYGRGNWKSFWDYPGGARWLNEEML